MGTEPNGKVFVYNFSTNTFYCFVDTSDHAVTSFMEYNGKLYVGTSPTGVVYSFDGVRWAEEYKTYGRGVKGMAVWDNELFVFCHGTESPLIYNGEIWSLLTQKESIESSSYEPQGSGSSSSSSSVTQEITIPETQDITVAALRTTTTKPFSCVSFDPIPRSSIKDVDLSIEDGDLAPEDKMVVTPPSPEFNFCTGAADGNRIVFGGSSKGRVYFYDGQNIGVLFDTDATGVSQIVNLMDGVNIVVMKERVYLLKTPNTAITQGMS